MSQLLCCLGKEPVGQAPTTGPHLQIPERGCMCEQQYQHLPQVPFACSLSQNQNNQTLPYRNPPYSVAIHRYVEGCWFTSQHQNYANWQAGVKHVHVCKLLFYKATSSPSHGNELAIPKRKNNLESLNTLLIFRNINKLFFKQFEKFY